MHPEAVELMIRKYKYCEARSKTLAVLIEEARKRLDEEQKMAPQEMYQEALKAQNYDATTHGNLPGNPVEDLVIKYESGYIPLYIREIGTDIRMMEDEMRECQQVCRLVEAWLSALKVRERYIIEHHMINGESWTEIIRDLEKQDDTGFDLTPQSMRRMQKAALQKIYEIGT